MNRTARIALLVGVVVVAVAAFVIARPGPEQDPSATTRSPAATAPASTAAGETTAPGTTSRPASPPTVVIRVSGGKPLGGVRKIEASHGERIAFRVSSDVADEVHVHGYDLHRDVAPGSTAAFSFAASIEGVFEVELENRAEQIAEVRVNP